jgi:glycosyltransferase involved in cell wall biosynthesis
MEKNRKMKVCHVANTDMAVNFLLLGQLKFLKTQDFDVYVVSSEGPLLGKVREAGIKTKTIDFKRRVDLMAHLVALVKLFFYFRKEKFDIVHTHTPVPGLLGQLAAKAAGVPVVINTIHGFYFQESDSAVKKRFYVFIEKIAAVCSSAIFSQNKQDIATAIKEKICAPSKIIYLGNGIDLARFDGSKYPENIKAAKRKELKIPAGVKVVGIVGRLVKEKGYLDLFEAFKTVLKKYPRSILLLVGPIENKKKDGIDLSIVKNYAIGGNTIFLGQRTDTEAIYPLMDVFVLPSYREGFPRTIIEASAMERPIVATRVRGNVEAVENNKTGFLVSPRNPEELAQAILYLLDNPEAAAVMGRAARKKAIEEFDETLVFNILFREYQRMIREKILNG